MIMSALDCILSGSLLLGKDVLWHGENSVTDLCLYTESCTEASQVLQVSFQLMAVVSLAAIKLFALSRDRYKVAQITEESKASEFLAETFNEEFNLCGTTTKALLIQVNDSNKQTQHTNMVVYGEKMDATSSITVYAQPFINDTDYIPMYEMTGFEDDTVGTKQIMLDEIFGMGHTYYQQVVQSSADLSAPNSRYTEAEIIDRIDQSQQQENDTIDLISEAKTAHKAQQRRHHGLLEKRTSRSFKPVPSKYSKPIKPTASTSAPTSSSLSSSIAAASTSASQASHHSRKNASIQRHVYDERKSMIRNAIKEELDRQRNNVSLSHDTTQLSQQIYTSVRYSYRDVIKLPAEMDRNKLRAIVKMHTDFYLNMDSIMEL